MFFVRSTSALESEYLGTYKNGMVWDARPKLFFKKRQKFWKSSSRKTPSNKQSKQSPCLESA
jgi:hypothetical protein